MKRELQKLRRLFGPHARIIKTDGGYMVTSGMKYLTERPITLRAIALSLALLAEAREAEKKNLDVPLTCRIPSAIRAEPNRGERP